MNATEYVRGVAAKLVGLRGEKRTTLSNRDRELARSWHLKGIPLDCVTEALEEVFRRRQERQEAGRVNSLAYCRWAVEEAWRDRQHLQVGSAAPPKPTIEPSPEGETRDFSAELDDKVTIWVKSGLRHLVPAADLQSWGRKVITAGRLEDPEAKLKEVGRLENHLLDLAVRNAYPGSRRSPASDAQWGVSEKIILKVDMVRTTASKQKLTAHIMFRMQRNAVRRVLELPTLA
ncbi:MAG: hypothetical protein F4X59_17565 [Holophagales bacterium]|nr:hypothetical protein [Holophagales bacterium]MYC11915.1 hypothetical protein [Holophagales bacterium]